MSYYTQNDEERVILNYFGNFTGTLLDIGANDGLTFSNSARLIEMGWKAVLVEPHPGAFSKLELVYMNNSNVQCMNVAISNHFGLVKFHSGSDSLLSTLDENQTHLWKGTTFEDGEVMSFDYRSLTDAVAIDKFDFISIDAEGMDWIILQQIDLSKTKMLCIEVGPHKTEIMKYCLDSGMKKIHQTYENLIFAR